jgi:hypothetical protein
MWKDSEHERDYVRGDSVMLVLEIKGALLEGMSVASRTCAFTSKKKKMGPQTTTTRNQFFHNYLNLEED